MNHADRDGCDCEEGFGVSDAGGPGGWPNERLIRCCHIEDWRLCLIWGVEDSAYFVQCMSPATFNVDADLQDDEMLDRLEAPYLVLGIGTLDEALSAFERTEERLRRDLLANA